MRLLHIQYTKKRIGEVYDYYLAYSAGTELGEISLSSVAKELIAEQITHSEMLDVVDSPAQKIILLKSLLFDDLQRKDNAAGLEIAKVAWRFKDVVRLRDLEDMHDLSQVFARLKDREQSRIPIAN
jgi:hypothetical protein